jgi:transposase-like protein
MALPADIEHIAIPLLLFDASVQQLLDLVHDHPDWPISALVANHPQNQNGAQGFSYTLAQAILKRLSLSTAIRRAALHTFAQKNKGVQLPTRGKIHPDIVQYLRSRCQQQTALVAQTPFSQQQKLQFLLRVVKERQAVTKVCDKAHLSRKRWYKWRKRYKQTGGNPDAFLRLLSPGKELVVQRPALVNSIFSLVTAHPEYGVVRLQRELTRNDGKPVIKRTRLAAFLAQQKLHTAQKRLAYAADHGNSQAQTQSIAGVYTKLSVKDKLALIQRVFKGEKAQHVCRETGVSLSVFYEWLRKYNDATGNPKSLHSRKVYPKGKTHPGYVHGVRQRILALIVSHPEYGADMISRALADQAGKPMLQPSTIVHFLRTMRLSTYPQRKAYAVTHSAGLSPAPNPYSE